MASLHAGGRGRQRRWGVSGGASVLAHAVLAGCAALALAQRDLVAGNGDEPSRDPTAVVGLDVDLVRDEELAPAVAAASGPEPPDVGAPLPDPASHPRRHAPPRVHVRTAPLVAVAVQAPTSPEVSDQQREEEPDGARASGQPDDGEDEMPLPGETASPLVAAGDGLAAGTAPTARLSAAEEPPQLPTEVSATEARYLRTYEAFPSLPRSLWVSGRVYAVLAQVCVDSGGGVSGVSIRDGAAPELDHAITSSVASWRYRPRVVEGAPRPFCHLMKFVYTTR